MQAAGYSYTWPLLAWLNQPLQWLWMSQGMLTAHCRPVGCLTMSQVVQVVMAGAHCSGRCGAVKVWVLRGEVLLLAAAQYLTVAGAA